MNFSLNQLQLEYIALINVSASLWNQYDIRTLVVEFSKSPLFTKLDDDTVMRSPQGARRKEWQKIENRVVENVSQLMIPSCFSKKILPFIQAVGFQVLKWLEYHRKVLKLDLDLPNEFHWTPQGLIDKKETSKFLIKDESIAINTRYKLACFYCIKYSIVELWNKMNDSDRNSLCNDESSKNAFQRRYLDFWKFYIIGELDKFKRKYKCTNSYLYMLQCSASKGNKAAIEYFLQKINSRETSLVETAMYVAKIRSDCYLKINDPPKEYLSEILCFLLSQMNSEQQVKVFEKSHFKVMCSLLDWPFQSFYVETASHLLNFLPEIKYGLLMRTVIHKTNLGFKDYAYHELFRDFWQIIPAAAKNSIISDSGIASLLGMLLWIKDKENLKLVFQTATVTEKRKFIFSAGDTIVCVDLILEEEWNLLRFFLKLCISSKDEMIQFKDQFETHLQARTDPVIKNSVFDKCCSLLKDLVNGYDKRKCADDNESGPAKKLCCIEFKDTTHSVDN